ncbi:LamB/YcsF family protein [Acuticoccus sp.]|uniref:LamB/YcsF family protein n=1 Tax=Acuticoccus sp. TaxID=1904378 RepID=UPI003B51918C
MRIDLNADCGESFGPWRMGDDAAILKVVTSANVACGFHAGDPDTMAATVALAKANGVAVGAHPGYEDRAGFGRRVIPMAPAAVTRMVAYQVGALAAVAALEGVRLAHVKAHGALSNHASVHRPTADAIVAAVRSVDPSLPLLATATTALEVAARDAGLPVKAEIFADRAYEPDGNLMSRAKPGAIVEDAEEAAARTVAMVRAGAVIAYDGTHVSTAIDSVCVHGDNAHAVAVASAVRDALEQAGVTVAASP